MNKEQTEIINDIYKYFESIYLSRNFPKPYYSNDTKRCMELMAENREEVSYLMYLFIRRNYNDLELYELVELALKVNQLTTKSFWDSFQITYLFPTYHNGLRLLALHACLDQLENLEFDIRWKNKSYRRMILHQQLEIFQNKTIIDKIFELFPKIEIFRLIF